MYDNHSAAFGAVERVCHGPRHGTGNGAISQLSAALQSTTEDFFAPAEYPANGHPSRKGGGI